MKRKFVFGVMLLVTVLGLLLIPGEAQAASATVEFTTSTSEVSTGSEFTVVCRVTSSEVFSDVEMKVLYDASIMEFVSGGRKVSGEDGILQISSTGNEDEVKKRTYSLCFKALKAGVGAIEMGKKMTVKNLEGDSFSVSANRVTLTVKEPESSEGAPDPAAVTPAPVATGAPSLSTNNKLKSLRFDCLSMTPEFDTNVLEYTVKVDCDTNILYFNYVAAHNKAAVRIKNNEELLLGENDVRIVVTAESGDKRVYKLKVIKESESETRVREQQEKGKSDITFSVYEKEGSIFIQNQYQFQVVDVKDDSILPSGYVKTSVELEGKNVTAYTMENDLDNNYLLMYLKGTGTEPVLYQYDRMERTVQRYTGTMTQKVNKGGNVAQEKEFMPESGAWLYAALVSMAVIILILLIVIVNMVLRRKLGRGKRELDDMDF
ncbi:MAG: hypothetical protein HFG34_02245 [Eubacterium sp.]|nr:hypothetical protein [Eubacterium sp.]